MIFFLFAKLSVVFLALSVRSSSLGKARFWLLVRTCFGSRPFEVEEMKKYFRDKVYKSIIPRNVRLSEAPSHGEPIIIYDAKSRGAEVYLELAREVIKNG